MKGILTKLQEKWLRKFLDNLIVLNGTLEMLDGLAIGAVISWFDNKFIESKVSDEIKTKLINVIDLGIARDLTGLAEYADAQIDIPKVSDDAEAVIFGTGVPFVASLIYSYVDSHSADETDVEDADAEEVDDDEE